MSNTYNNDDAVAVESAPLPLPLDGWHRARGGRMVEFAGYHLPIQYEGIIAEHLWTREHAGLFDVSHMGQINASGEGVAAALEALLPGDLAGLAPGKMRYSLLLGEDGGILDDLIVTNLGQSYHLVVNGATKWDDIGHLREHLPDEITLHYHERAGLLALQGPEAVDALERLVPGVAALGFMEFAGLMWEKEPIGVSRSGYTGEDGFEISVPFSHIESLAEALCAQPQVKPIGLGARDSLRLEAGLPLYGHDLDATTMPFSAGLGFAINKRRRLEGGFPGAAAILAEAGAPRRRRVGLVVEGRMAVREGAAIFTRDNLEVGHITSGGFSPTLQQPIAMGYVASAHAAPGTRLEAEARGRRIGLTVAPLPFVPHRYHRPTT